MNIVKFWILGVFFPVMAAGVVIANAQHQNSITWKRHGKGEEGRSRWVRNSVVCKEDACPELAAGFILGFSLFFLLSLLFTHLGIFIRLGTSQRLPCQLSDLLWCLI